MEVIFPGKESYWRNKKKERSACARWAMWRFHRKPFSRFSNWTNREESLGVGGVWVNVVPDFPNSPDSPTIFPLSYFYQTADAIVLRQWRRHHREFSFLPETGLPVMWP